jgi:chemosensory pili system protein ChpA (sensor histidine kinase/response regulator)
MSNLAAVETVRDRAAAGSGRAQIAWSANAVANETLADLDLGPLLCVRREIDETLNRGLASLAAFCKREKDVAALHDARMHVHQAAGAIRMLGLDAVAEFTDEIERCVTHLEGLAPSNRQAAGDMVERSCRKLSIFLREITAGAAPAALKLFPEYRAMRRSRGEDAATPSDLFYPDLRTRGPRAALREAIPAKKLLPYLAKKRRTYQGGLLSWLRGDDAGAKAMREAVAGIEAVTSNENLRWFWWTVRAFLEAMTCGGLEDGSDLKQLAGRIDLQMRRVAEGSAEVADRLRREVLYYVAISAPVSPAVRAVQRAFRLSSLIPPPEAIDMDVVGIEPLLREARDRLVRVKQTWLSFASGRTDHLVKLKQALTLFQTRAAEIGQPALAKLIASLAERLDHLSSGEIPDPLAMEFTTALLLAEDALENLANLPPEFPQQVDAMLARLDGVAAGRLVPGDATTLGQLGKRARERLLLAQVGNEIQSNLRRMEAVLDTFFRDADKRTELASLAKELSQVHGALRILGLDAADRLLSLCDERIQAYAHPDTEVAEEELELLAESLCGLGFYVEEVGQQRRESERVLAPLLARWLGEPVQPPSGETELVEAEPSGDQALASKAHADAAELGLAGVGSAAPDKPAVRPNSIRGARTIAESGITPASINEWLSPPTALAAEPSHANAVISEPSSPRKMPAAETSRANAAISEPPSPPKTPADEPAEPNVVPGGMQRAALVHSVSIETLAAVHDEIDTELLARFLGEAYGLYSALAKKFLGWRRAPDDEAAADELCRTLHEIKGGARMAGAMRLGQLLHLIESQVLANKHRAPAPELFDVLDADIRLVSDMLDRLRAGESNVELPWLGPKTPAETEHGRVVEAIATAPQGQAAGPAAVADANVGMRDLKSNLAELANSVTRLRTQLREIEIQTDLQIRPRMTELNDPRSDGDPSALEGFRRIRSLTQSLAEALTGLTTLQQALLRSLDEADSAPSPARAVNAN